jgi:hypothetical protein
MLSGYEADRCRRRNANTRSCLMSRLIVRHSTAPIRRDVDAHRVRDATARRYNDCGYWIKRLMKATAVSQTSRHPLSMVRAGPVGHLDDLGDPWVVDLLRPNPPGARFIDQR